MRRKKADDLDVQASGEGRITPGEVQQVEFRLSFRGYNERDVDAFLDRITEDLSGYLAELEQLRGGAPAGIVTTTASDSVPAPQQADAIVARAREEASAIIRRAEQQAAAVAASGAGGGEARAAVAPFLNKEREFLQGLGGLVQTHAEEIKQMVLALRSRAEAAPPPPPAMAARGAEAPAGAATATEIRERLGDAAPPADPPERPEPEPIVVDPGTEPAYSSEGAPANEGRERSLRELFWGED